MRQWPVPSDKRSCPVLTTAPSKSCSLPVCVCDRARFVCATLVPLHWSRRPHLSAPWDSCTPPRGFRQQACPSLPATFLIRLPCAYLLSFLSGYFVLHFPSLWLLSWLPNFLQLYCGAGWFHGGQLFFFFFFFFPHRACDLVARWRYSLDAQWLRCEASINEQQIRAGGGKTTAVSLFSSPASALSGQENRSGERRTAEEGLLAVSQGVTGWV